MLPLPGLNKQGRETWMLPDTPEVTRVFSRTTGDAVTAGA